MSALSEKMRRARETRVEAGKFTFIVRRPTDMEFATLHGAGPGERILPFVVGWEGVKEMDLINGGDPHPLAFDEDACREWLSDRPDLFTALADAVIASYVAHVESREAALKN